MTARELDVLRLADIEDAMQCALVHLQQVLRHADLAVSQADELVGRPASKCSELC